MIITNIMSDSDNYSDVILTSHYLGIISFLISLILALTLVIIPFTNLASEKK